MNYKEVLNNFVINEFYIFNYNNHYIKIVKCIYHEDIKSFQLIKNIKNGKDIIGTIVPIHESTWWKYTKLTDLEKLKYL